nr:hypothetical protein [Tanacetum cinerariifolium]
LGYGGRLRVCRELVTGNQERLQGVSLRLAGIIRMMNTSTSHNVFNERLEDACFDASTSFHDLSNVHTFYQPYPREKKWTKDHPLHKIIGDPKSSVRTRGQLANSCLFSCLLSSIEPANVAEALRDTDWVSAMQEELDQFARLKVWRLVPRPEGKTNIKTKWIFKNKKDESSLIVQIYLWIIDSGCSKHMTGNRALLTNFVEKFLGTVRFGNNDFAMIAGYGDVVIDGVDFLTGDHLSNFYTIALNEVASNSSTCLLAKASSFVRTREDSSETSQVQNSFCFKQASLPSSYGFVWADARLKYKWKAICLGKCEHGEEGLPHGFLRGFLWKKRRKNGMKNKELNEQLKVLIEKNDALLAQTNVLKDQLQFKHVVIDNHVECQERYAKLEAERYEYMIRYSAYFYNDKQHRKHIADQEVLYDKISVQLVELDKHTVHMIMPSKDTLYNGRKGIGFKNPSYFEKAKDLRPSLYDEKVIGLGYSPMFLTHSDEALEIEKFKRARENKIEFAYDYGSLNASYVNEKIKFSDDYFQEIINPDFDKIDSPFQQTSSLKPHSKLNKDVKRYSRKDLLSCNNPHLRETSSAYDCNDAMNVSCNSKLCDLFDESNLFIFDDESVRIYPVSKMPFTKKPRDSMNVRSKSNSNKSLPRTVHRWLPKVQPLAEHVAKWIPKIVQICLWIIDSGCSKYMTGNCALLMNFMEKFLGTVCFGNNDFAVIAGYGDVVIGSMTIKKVYYVKGLGHNLFSVEQFCDKGLEVAFRKSTCFVRNEDGVDLLTGDHLSNLYTIALNEVASNSSTCLLEKASSSQSWLWHQRLSHLTFATINNLMKNNLVQGLPKVKFKKYHLCFACEQGKIHRKHHKSKTAFASIKPLYLLHMDLCGPMRVESINRKRYVLVVVDDYSRTPQQNGVVERKNQTLVEAARTMLTFVNLPLSLWAEAIAIACFTQNRSIIHNRFDKTPYGLMNKRKPNIKFFRVFGCRCYLLNDYEDVGKLKAKGDIGVFVSYLKESAAFRIYNKQTRKMHKNVNSNFDEISEMASKQFSLEPGLSNLNETRKSSNPSVSQVSKTSKKDLEDLFQKFYDEYFDSSKIMKSSTTNVETSNVEIPRMKKKFFMREVGVPSSNTQSISNNMIPNVDEASTSYNVFNERLEDAYFDASKTIIRTKWIFKNKKDESSLVIRNKERLIPVGYSHQEGIDYDETFAPVARIEAICLFLAYVDHKDFTVFHLDVKTAFLNEILKEEVFGMEYCDTVPTLMVEQAKLKLDLVRKPLIILIIEVLWMRTQLMDYGIFYDKVPIYCNSKSAIAISCNPVQYTRTKHIDMRTGIDLPRSLPSHLGKLGL